MRTCVFFEFVGNIKRCGTKVHAESTDREPESSAMEPIRDKTVIWSSCGILSVVFLNLVQSVHNQNNTLVPCNVLKYVPYWANHSERDG